MNQSWALHISNVAQLFQRKEVTYTNTYGYGVWGIMEFQDGCLKKPYMACALFDA